MPRVSNTPTPTEVLQRRVDAGGDEHKSNFWRSFGLAVKRAAVATGRGTAWLAKAGYDNRNYVPAIINGAVGDKLAASDDSLAITMSFRADARDVPAADLDVQSPHVAVFVHGLMADEAYWTRPFGGHAGFGPTLASTLGLTPLYLRYNTGLHISHNGEALAALLEELAETHPGIERITVCGHSMGGLVARSAGHYGSIQRNRWTRLVDSVVLLGAPNDGSFLEQAAHLSSWVLETIPTLTTNIIAWTINSRSDGIKDLRLGLLVAEDWRRDDSASMSLRDRTDVPPMAGVHYHLVVGTLTESADSIVATYFGDGLVGGKSALAARDDTDHGAASIRWRVFAKTNHLALVSSPDVQQFVSDALAVRALLEPGATDDTASR